MQTTSCNTSTGEWVGPMGAAGMEGGREGGREGKKGCVGPGSSVVDNAFVGLA